MGNHSEVCAVRVIVVITDKSWEQVRKISRLLQIS